MPTKSTTDVEFADPARTGAVIVDDEPDVELADPHATVVENSAGNADGDGSRVVAAEPWSVPPFPHPRKHPFRAFGWVAARLYGIASLVLLLAVVAAIPLVNFYALGYLLEAEGRVARSGRIRDGFPMLGLAPRFGSIVVAFALFLLPVVLLNSAARDAIVIDSASAATARMETVAGVVTVLVAIHLCLSLARGGKFTNFLRPIKNVRWLWKRWRERDYWATAERNVASFAAELRLRERFWLGWRGFWVGISWLLLPALVLISEPPHREGAIAFALVGSLLLIPVVSWLPFLQARFAAEERFRAGFDLKTIRQAFRRAPFCWLLAALVTYSLSLPLYLLKIAGLPGDARWLAMIVFVLAIWPARLLTGWAYAQATRRDEPAHWLWRWGDWLLMLPVLGFYVLVLYLTRYVAEIGRFEQLFNHAFLLPLPPVIGG